MQNKPLAHSNSQGDIHPIIVVVSALLITEVNGWTAAKDPLCWCFELCFTICRIGKRREERGERGAVEQGGRTHSLGVWGHMEPALRLHFIAHLAVLINGKPVHRTQKTEVIALCQWAFTACLFLSHVQKTFLDIFYLACGPWYEFASVCHAFINILNLLRGQFDCTAFP